MMNIAERSGLVTLLLALAVDNGSASSTTNYSVVGSFAGATTRSLLRGVSGSNFGTQELGNVDDDDMPWENCTNLLQNIAVATATFEHCALMQARPFKMCESCVSQYSAAIGIFNQLQDNKTDPIMILCKDQFFSSSMVSIVYKTYVHVLNLWSSASCDACFDDPVTQSGSYVVSNHTILFNEKLNKMNECVNRSESRNKNRTDLCTSCEGPYRDLNAFYDTLVQKDQASKICFDMVDAMNATHFLWSSHLCSVHQYSNTPTFLVGGVVGLLVVLFYGGIGLVINPLNTELVPPKRLFRVRSRYGSSSTTSQTPKPGVS